MARSEVLAALGVAVVAVACNAISGIDRFDEAPCEGPCPPVALPEADSGPDALPDAGSRDAEVPDAASADGGDPRRLWARWPLEQDGGIEETADGVFRDSTTGLTWTASAAATTEEAAARYCAALGLGMSLPSRIELVTLLDERPATDATHARAPFASETEVFFARGTWTVDFASGLVRRNGASRVRCVRPEPALGSAP